MGITPFPSLQRGAMSSSTSGPLSSQLRVRDQWVSFGIVLSIILLGFFLRFYQLGAPGLNSDGIQIVRRALGTATGYDFGNGLIFSQLLRVLLQFLPQNDYFVRLPAAVFGVAAIPLIYFIGVRLFERSTAIVAALLLAISVLHIHQSRHVHSYTLVLLLSIWSFYLMLKALESQRIRYWLLLGFCNGLGILAHHFAVFYIASEFLIIFSYLLSNRSSDLPGMSLCSKTLAVRLGISGALTIIIALPVFIQIKTPLMRLATGIFGLETGAASAPRRLDPALWFDCVIRLVSDFTSIVGRSPVSVIVVCTLFLVGLIVLFIRSPRVAWPVLLWLIVPILPAIIFTQLSGLNFHSRRLIFLLPIWLLVISYGITFIGEWVVLQLPFHGRIRLVVCAFCITGASVSGWLVVGAPTHRYVVNLRKSAEHWKEIAAFLGRVTLPEDAIVIWPERSLRYYFSFPERTVLDTEWDPQVSAGELQVGRRLWFVYPLAYKRFVPNRAAVMENWILDHGLESFQFDQYVRVSYSSGFPEGSLDRFDERIFILQVGSDEYPAGRELRNSLRDAGTRRQNLLRTIDEYLGGAEQVGEDDSDGSLLIADGLAEDFPGEALRYYDQLIKSDPDNGSAHLGRGKVLLTLRRYSDGMLSLRRACEYSRGSAAANGGLRQSFPDSGVLEEAIVAVEDLASRDRGVPVWLMLRIELARLLFEELGVTEAVQSLEETVAELKNMNGLDELPVIENHVLEGLSPIFDMLCELNLLAPDNPSIRWIGAAVSLTYAEALIAHNEPDRAEASYLQYRKFSSSAAGSPREVQFAHYCKTAADRLRASGDNDSAEATYELAIRVFQSVVASNAHRNASNYLSYGRVLSDRGRLEEARRALEVAIKLDPHKTEAWANLCAVLRRMNRSDDALVACQETTRLRPDHFFANLWTAQIFASQDHWNESIVAAEMASLRSPTADLRCKSLEILARSYVGSENADQACEVYREMIAICTKHEPRLMLKNLGCAD